MPKNPIDRNEILTASSLAPKYFHFATVICERYRSSPVGTTLPAITELARRFSVSKQTINRSMIYLAERGFVKSERGRGTSISRDLGEALGLPSPTGNSPQSVSDNIPFIQRSRTSSTTPQGGIGMVLKAQTHAGTVSRNIPLAQLEIVMGLQHELREAGLPLITIVIKGSGAQALESQLAEASTISAYIFMTKSLDRSEAERVVSLGKPVIMLNEDHYSDLMTCVVAAEADGMDQLMQHLFSLGHQKIGFLALTTWDMESPRYAGYSKAMKKAQLPEQVVNFDIGKDSDLQTAARERTPQILEQFPGCTALITATPLPGQGLCEGLRDMGKEPGKDLSLACFGFIEEEWNSIAKGHDKITTVVKPRYEMGRCTIQLLFDQLQRNYTQVGTIRIPCPLLIGTTTTSLRGPK